MNRDPKNIDCTRDPIYLLQIATRLWTEIPEGLEHNGESLIVESEDDLHEWIRPFIEWQDVGVEHRSGTLVLSTEFYEAAESVQNSNGWPLIYTEWRTEGVFLTRPEAEAWASARSYRWDLWRVYCVCCEGELATILNGLESLE